MTEPKHTKGPWKVEADSDGQEMRIIAPQISYIAQPGERLRTHGYGCGNNFICDLNDMEYHEYTDIEEQRANGDLLADAWQLPDLQKEIKELKEIKTELIEALEYACDSCEEVLGRTPKCTSVYILGKALRKARGETE